MQLPLTVDSYRYTSARDHALVVAFRRKLSSGYYSLSDYACPICDNFKEWHPIAFAAEGFAWDVCQTCGLLQLRRRMNPNHINEFYESGEYQQICMGGLDDQRHFNLEYHVMSLHILECFKRGGIDISSSRVAEIGCGSGGILLALKEAGVDQVIGFDLDPHRIKIGQKYLPEITTADALSNEIDLSQSNVVLVSNVLEHLTDPSLFLSALRAKLHPATSLVIDVPNLEGAHAYGDSFADFLHVGHLWYFTSITLERLLHRCGFKVDTLLNRGPAMSVVCSLTEPETLATTSARLSLSAIDYAINLRDPQSAAKRAQASLRVLYGKTSKPFPFKHSARFVRNGLRRCWRFFTSV